MKECFVDGCRKKVVAKGFCDRHYRRSKEGLEMTVPIIEFGLSLKDRVLKGMDIKDLKTGCVNWKMYRNPDGYGQFGFNGKKVFAHRSSYEVFIGEIPKGFIVRHICDNPSCVNPEHLEIGTKQDNSNDCISRGRFPLGEKHWNTTLSNEQVVCIRDYYSTGNFTLLELGKRFGVSFQTISRIVRREVWIHLV